MRLNPFRIPDMSYKTPEKIGKTKTMTCVMRFISDHEKSQRENGEEATGLLGKSGLNFY